jgi:hypothetical protein
MDRGMIFEVNMPPVGERIGRKGGMCSPMQVDRYSADRRESRLPRTSCSTLVYSTSSRAPL